MANGVIKLFFILATTFLAYSMNQPKNLIDTCASHLIKNNRLLEAQTANIPQELKDYIKEYLEKNTKLLFNGIYNSNVETVKEAIRNGVDVNTKNFETTPLDIAIDTASYSYKNAKTLTIRRTFAQKWCPGKWRWPIEKYTITKSIL